MIKSVIKSKSDAEATLTSFNFRAIFIHPCSEDVIHTRIKDIWAWLGWEGTHGKHVAAISTIIAFIGFFFLIHDHWPSNPAPTNDSSGTLAPAGALGQAAAPKPIEVQQEGKRQAEGVRRAEDAAHRTSIGASGEPVAAHISLADDMRSYLAKRLMEAPFAGRPAFSNAVLNITAGPNVQAMNGAALCTGKADIKSGSTVIVFSHEFTGKSEEGSLSGKMTLEIAACHDLIENMLRNRVVE